MSLQQAGLIAGVVSTVLFVVSYVPMLAKAVSTRDLSSYSPSSLLVANLGNAIHSVYVFSLPPGPIWALHTFYLVSSALMLFWWWRYHGRPRSPADRTGRKREPRCGLGAQAVVCR